MITENSYQLWVNWDEYQASLHPVPGFETVTFCSEQNDRTNLQLLIQSGFQIQGGNV